LALASSLQPLWYTRARVREGRAWFDTVLTDEDPHHLEVAAAVRARALADKALLDSWALVGNSTDQARQALAIAREVDDPALLARALTACGYIAGQVADAEAARRYFAEAVGLARARDDRWRLSQILGWQATTAAIAGGPLAARATAEEGRDLADAIGDRFDSRKCRWCLGQAQLMQGDLVGAVAQFGELVAEAEEAHDVTIEAFSLGSQGWALAYQGDTSAARRVADAMLESAEEFGEEVAGFGYMTLAVAALAAADVETAQDACAAARQPMSFVRGTAAVWGSYMAQAALAGGDLIAARRWADDAVATATGFHLMEALATRARVEIAQGEPRPAERDAYDALECAARLQAYQHLPDILECLAELAGAGSHGEAARLFGAAEAFRQRVGMVRFKVWDAGYETSIAALRDVMGDNDFDHASAEGAALSTEEAIAYAQRGRGERKRPASGWASLTPAELDVVRLVSEGLANKDIATRLFVSRRTVQAHLTHVYTKLGLGSRVQLVQEAARRN
jgi:DNA-binding CsgD family transcriptional regulator/tetratricopeptide (TPR) repeat protein